MLEMRQIRGFKADTYIRPLLSFDRFCTEQDCTVPELTQELVFGWLNSPAGLSDLNDNALAIRHFGTYLHAIEENTYILPNKFTPRRHHCLPYIFTDSEITALFEAIDSLPPTESEPFLNEIAPVIFRLIYTCGLRPNEGRNILKENVNIETGEILIDRTKNRKERIVVMSDDMSALAKRYNLRLSIFGNDSPYFFPAKDGNAISDRKLYAAFNKAWSTVSRPNGKTPFHPARIYDLRHRFASACLNRWLDKGENLKVMLPFLRAYMGHSSLSETAYYIHILPENLTKSPGIDWEALDAILPEVEV
jgi:integrase